MRIEGAINLHCEQIDLLQATRDERPLAASQVDEWLGQPRDCWCFA
jgi:hypothetical protein